jgi:hypothetical protein
MTSNIQSRREDNYRKGTKEEKCEKCRFYDANDGGICNAHIIKVGKTKVCDSFEKNNLKEVVE